MKLVFDPDFDGRAWPGPLAGREAICGENWVGPNMLLNLLETTLGLGGRWQSDAARAAALVPAVRETQGFWSKSAEVDPLGTASTLLHWRDELWMAGWRGQPVAPRLKALAAVTLEAIFGSPDRLQVILETIEKRWLGNTIWQLDLLCSEESLPLLWRKILAALKKAGCEVRIKPLTEAKAKGDLADARTGKFVPTGDGSIELLRVAGPLAAAETVAAWLASFKSLDQVVVVTPAPVLDAALLRYGLPTTGAAEEHDNALLQIVPLALAMAWSPPDPQRALELLTLPNGPVPKGIARRLVRALQEWPAVDSDLWREQLKAGIDECEPDRRKRVGERLQTLWGPAVRRGSPFPATEIRKRIAAVEKWVQGRKQSVEDDAPWTAVAAQCSELRKLIDLCGLKDLTEPQLDWLVEEATNSVPAAPPHPWQAGLGAVDSPGGLAGSATRAVWWDFTRDAVPGTQALPLSPGEKAALKTAGVDLVSPGAEALSRSERWHRPLKMASECLLLVCPFQDEAGEELFPHPLWDEVGARIDDKKAGASLMVREPSLPKAEKRQRSSLVLPTNKSTWQLPGGKVQPREQESPSSFGKLIGCPLKYVVEYLAKMYGGETGALPEGPKLLGKLAHELIERVLAKTGSSPESVAKSAADLFDQEGPRLAASLFLPGAESQRATAKQAITKSAQTLAAFLQQAGLVLIAVETDFERNALGIKVGGRPDILLGPKPAIIDLKWHDKGSYKLAELRTGTAYQLATYSFLVSQGQQPSVPVAYFLVDGQRLLTTGDASLAGAEKIKGPGPAETWAALKAAYERETKMLYEGVVRAPISPDGEDEETSGIDRDSGALVLGPPCRFCDLGLICGTLGK